MAWSTKNHVSPAPPTAPDRYVKLGEAEGWWFEPESGVAVIRTVGGTVDDRWLLEGILKDRLAAVGIRQATFAIDPAPDFQKTAQWTDIMAKAKRLVQSGNVQLLRNGYNNIVAHVVGDHGEYTSEISRDDPSSRAITQWTCECPWDQYAFQRTRQWKKYEARPCAHVLATYWKSLSTPIDEELTPDQAGGMGTGQALPGGGAPPMQSPMGSPFDGGTFYPDGSQQLNPAQPQMMPGMGQEQTPLGQPGYDPSQMPAPPQMMADPAQQSVIPPFPMDQSQMQLPVSVPGGRPGPYPANPLQQGGTLSSVPRTPQWLMDEFERNEPEVADLYHVAPTSERARIIQHGLQPSSPALNERWYEPDYDRNDPSTPETKSAPRWLQNQPHGVYTEADPDKALETWGTDHRGPNDNQRYDVWRIPRDQYDPENLHTDPITGSSVIPHVVHPQLLEGPEHRLHTAKKGDTFLPDTSARVEEDTLGQSEGREGAIDAGQWMNVPKGTNVVVVHQDPTTGWVECMMPLKGGPMTSYHVRFFIEPEKLTPLNRPNTPFQNPKR